MEFKPKYLLNEVVSAVSDNYPTLYILGTITQVRQLLNEDNASYFEYKIQVTEDLSYIIDEDEVTGVYGLMSPR